MKERVAVSPQLLGAEPYGPDSLESGQRAKYFDTKLIGVVFINARFYVPCVIRRV